MATRQPTSLRTLVGTIGLVVALTTAVLLPVGYFVLGYTSARNVLDYKAELSARTLAKYIFTHNQLWQYQRVRLAELLEQTDFSREPQRQRVIDAAGKEVVGIGSQLDAPLLVRDWPISVAGAAVGRVELATSLRDLWLGTGLVALLSSLLGCGIYFAVRVFPLRVLDQTLGTLEKTNRRFDAALNNMLQGLLMFDSEERLVVYNKRFLSMFDIAPESVRQDMMLAELVNSIVPHNALFQEDAQEIVAEKRRFWSNRERAVRLRELSDGRVISVMHEPIVNGGWLTTYEDITDRRKAEAKIAYMARYDMLTELPNRSFFREEMEHSLRQIHRDKALAVLCLDLDYFKRVNDALGHPIGDALLKQVAQRLSACVRKTDVVARLGGDEFAIIQASGDTQPQEASALASRLIEAVSAPYLIEGFQVVVGLSIGIAIAPADGNDADQLLKSADMALYRAKEDGRGTYRYFEPGMDARAQARRLLELDLRAALRNNEFELYYQPIFQLESEQIIGLEALVRWNHPHRGMIQPNDFIPLAEETGLIVPLGNWVLQRACADAATWSRPVRVAVNLSPIQFKQKGLVDAVLSALANSGLTPDQLELEITEAVLLTDSEATLATLHSLRNHGVRISMDDFGTGYSSLSYLRSFPFDKIKIDRTFINELSNRNDSMAIVRAVTGLGTSLGIPTTAEGVETSEQLRLLRGVSCTEVQGYLFSPPRPATEVEGLLSGNLASRAVA